MKEFEEVLYDILKEVFSHRDKDIVQILFVFSLGLIVYIITSPYYFIRNLIRYRGFQFYVSFK